MLIFLLSHIYLPKTNVNGCSESLRRALSRQGADGGARQSPEPECAAGATGASASLPPSDRWNNRKTKKKYNGTNSNISSNNDEHNNNRHSNQNNDNTNHYNTMKKKKDKEEKKKRRVSAAACKRCSLLAMLLAEISVKKQNMQAWRATNIISSWEQQQPYSP